MQVLRNFTISVAFYGKLHYSAYLNTINFANEEPFSVSKRTQFLKVLRSLTSLVAFYTNVLHFQILNNWKKIPKTHLYMKRNPKFERSEQSYFFRTHSTSNLLPLAIFENFVFFLENPCFFREKQILHVLRNFTISVAFYVNFAAFSIYKNNQLFYQKNLLFLKNKPIFWKFWEVLLIRSYSAD